MVTSVFLQFLPAAIIVSASPFSTFEFSGVLPFVSNEIDDHDISLLGENSLVLKLQKYYHELIEAESKK